MAPEAEETYLHTIKKPVLNFYDRPKINVLTCARSRELIDDHEKETMVEVLLCDGLISAENKE